MKVRKRFITDVVENYKKNHKKEYKAFLEIMKVRKAGLEDRNYAELNGATEIRNAMSMPEGIAVALETVLTGTDEPAFGEPKGELKWFTKKFPEFLIPNKY